MKKRDREIVQRLKETGTINDGGLCVQDNERRKKRTRQLLNVMSNVYHDDDVGESQIMNFDAVWLYGIANNSRKLKLSAW